MPDERYYVGLISGTSVDAVDAALLHFPAHDQRAELVATHGAPPPPDLRDALLALTRAKTRMSLADFGALDQRVGEWFADAALALMDKTGTTPERMGAIGSHGQTVWHEPGGAHPFSLQIGSPSVIAARTGCRVVADFRSSDIAVGGQGAPLVCAFHRSVFARRACNRIVINIGGIANLTLLPTAAVDDLNAVTGLDTGPGNALMDAWTDRHLGRPLDADGRWAASGRVHPELLDEMLRDAYFARPAPKSTGREYFNLAWLDDQLARQSESIAPADVQATLCELTAITIADAIVRHGPGDEELLLCGGGARNPQLRSRLAAHVGERALATTNDYGIDADWVEAAAFAWLAMRTCQGKAGNVPRVTGARRAVPLGGIYEAHCRHARTDSHTA